MKTKGDPMQPFDHPFRPRALFALLASSAMLFATPAFAELRKGDTGRGSGDPMAAAQAEQALSQCLLRSVDADDKRALVNWIFAVMARHPDVRPMSRMDAATDEKVGRAASDVLERLLADRCASEVRAVVRTSSFENVGNSFQVLGKVAMQDLMAHPDVEAGVGDLLKYVDFERVSRSLLQE
jgi:hypothetical protein